MDLLNLLRGEGGAGRTATADRITRFGLEELLIRIAEEGAAIRIWQRTQGFSHQPSSHFDVKLLYEKNGVKVEVERSAPSLNQGVQLAFEAFLRTKQAMS